MSSLFSILDLTSTINKLKTTNQKDVATHQQGGTVGVTLLRQSKVKSEQTYEFIKYESGDIMLHSKKKNDNFWKSLSARYTDSEIKRLDERDKTLFDADAVQAKGAERWWEIRFHQGNIVIADAEPRSGHEMGDTIVLRGISGGTLSL